MGTNLLNNYEGYPDPTAYTAINNQTGLSDFVDGMVIKLINFNETESFRVLLKVFDNYATTLVLYPYGKDGEYEINVNGKSMYVDLGRIGHTKAVSLLMSEVVDTLAEDKYIDLMKNVARHMGMPGSDAENWDELLKCREEIKQLKSNIDAYVATVMRHEERERDLTAQLDEMKAAGDVEGDEKLMVAISERNLYRQLYNELLGRILVDKIA